MQNDKEKSINRNHLIVALGVAILCAIILRSCGAGTEGCSDTDRTINDTGSRIEQSLQSNQQFQSGIRDAETTTDRLTNSLDRGAETVSEAAGTVTSLESNIDIAADAIRKCQSIIADVKRRNEERSQEP